MADGYRKIWLVNSLGNKYYMSDKNLNPYVFFSEIGGFGLDREYTAQRIGNTEVLLSQQFKLTDITGTLVFYNINNGLIYQDYQNFIQFIKHKPLELHYQTPNTLENYYSNVLITKIDKKEIDSDNGSLQVPLTFHRLTQWLTDKDYVITLTNSTSIDGKEYPLERPYHYPSKGLSNIEIINNGTDDVGFTLLVEGDVQNLTFNISQGGEVYGICKINGEYDYVELNSVEQVDTLYLEKNGSSFTNPEQYQDLTIANGSAYITWCKFRPGTSIFNFSCGNIETFDGKVTVKLKNSYVSV